MAIFQYKIIIFQGQFSILSAFSVEKSETKLAFALQFATRLDRHALAEQRLGVGVGARGHHNPGSLIATLHAEPLGKRPRRHRGLHAAAVRRGDAAEAAGHADLTEVGGVDRRALDLHDEVLLAWAGDRGGQDRWFSALCGEVSAQ